MRDDVAVCRYMVIGQQRLQKITKSRLFPQHNVKELPLEDNEIKKEINFMLGIHFLS
jgi:hypothetical protein